MDEVLKLQRRVEKDIMAYDKRELEQVMDEILKLQRRILEDMIAYEKSERIMLRWSYLAVFLLPFSLIP